MSALSPLWEASAPSVKKGLPCASSTCASATSSLIIWRINDSSADIFTFTITCPRLPESRGTLITREVTGTDRSFSSVPFIRGEVQPVGTICPIELSIYGLSGNSSTGRMELWSITLPSLAR
ncbi:hypothetical protein D3C75_885230 [compost metagenome]